MRVRLGSQIGQVDVSAAVTIHHHDFHARHVRRGRVGAVRGCRNQADDAVRLTAAAVIGADGKQTRIFSLRAGIGLERNRIIARDHRRASRRARR